ncbi:MAG: TolC family protein [Myxococcota bacterium]
MGTCLGLLGLGLLTAAVDPAVELRLGDALALANAKSAELAVERARAAAQSARADAAGRLPDLELKYEEWGVPLARPYALDQAGMLMVGLRQSIPPPGSLGAEARASQAKAEQAEAEAARRALDLELEVTRAFYSYAQASSELELHRTHRDLVQGVVTLSRAGANAGLSEPAEILEAHRMLARLGAEIAESDALRIVSAARLNRWMHREPDAPLGPARWTESSTTSPGEAEVQEEAPRPEIRARHAEIQAATAEADAKRQAERWPSFMLGLDYWYQPLMEPHHAYGAMLSMSLPWLNPQHSAETRAAEAEVLAAEEALVAERQSFEVAVVEAKAKLRSARIRLRILSQELLPLSEQALATARSNMSGGRVSALAVLNAARADLELRIEALRAEAELCIARAELARAQGRTIDHE